jgi:Fic family protein
VTDPNEALQAASAAVYRPFPAFAEWAGLNVDSAAFERTEQDLAELKQTTTSEVLAEAVATATRSAAVDTGAIEGLYQVDRGFTRTIATEAANWEVVFGAREEETQRAIEDALRAYEFVLDAATGSRGPITEVWIKHLHATICASQKTYRVYTAAGPQDQPLPKGEYKTQPNSPINLTTGRVHAYASILDTAPEMGRLIGELNSPDFMVAHPVLQAAYAHYAFVCIHPFADGNGRVSRALASVYLYRKPGIPLVIFADQKPDYLDALELADAGEPQPFINFITARAIDAVIMVTIELARITARQRRIGLHDDFDKALRTGAEGLLHADLDAAANRVLDRLHSAFITQLSSLELPGGVNIDVSRQLEIPSPHLEYRRVDDQLSLRLRANSDPPVKAYLSWAYASYVSSDGRASPSFAIFSSDNEGALEFTVTDLVPVLSQITQWRIDAWAEVELTRILEQLYIIGTRGLHSLSDE